MLADAIQSLGEAERFRAIVAAQLDLVDDALKTARAAARVFAGGMISAAAPSHERYLALQSSSAWNQALDALLKNADAPLPEFPV
jgi:hypothetical protein